VPLTERTAPELRGKMYSKQMTEQTYKKLVENGLSALATHNGVILDATFSSRANRDFLRDQCAKADVHLQVIELEAQPETIKNRLRTRDHSASEISDARLEDVEKLTAAYEPPSERAADLIKISANKTAGDTVKSVLLRLTEKQLH